MAAAAETMVDCHRRPLDYRAATHMPHGSNGQGAGLHAQSRALKHSLQRGMRMQMAMAGAHLIACQDLLD